MSDLVERLRGQYRIPITDGLGPAGGEEPDNPAQFIRTFPTTPIQREAAAEIERLEREVEAWKGAAKAAGLCMSCSGPYRQQGPCTDCLDTGFAYGDPCAAAEARATAAEARVREAVEVIAPFAAEWPIIEQYIITEPAPGSRPDIFRRAANFLAKLGEPS